jgi:methylenetetrahydrofolate reductase (NADPH)
MGVADLKSHIVEFVRRASTEVTPHDEGTLAELAATLPRGAAVYVAHTPKARFEDVVHVSRRVQELGLSASPHLVARRLPGEQELRRGLRELSNAGIDQALLVAGDCTTAHGPYESTLDVLASGVLAGSGIRRLGIAGHPEGHPEVDSDRLWTSLRFKQTFGENNGIAVHVVTQFGFDPHGVQAWVEQFPSHGIALPVHVGIAGPTSLTKLLRFAMQCGVAASLQSAARNMKAVSGVVRHATTPEDMVPALAEMGAGSVGARIVQPHFFSFGGAVATAKWIRRVMDGHFRLMDGRISLHE